MSLSAGYKFVMYEHKLTGKTALSFENALENRLLEGAKL